MLIIAFVLGCDSICPLSVTLKALTASVIVKALNEVEKMDLKKSSQAN